MSQQRLLGLVLCGLVLFIAGTGSRRSRHAFFQATPTRAAIGAFERVPGLPGSGSSLRTPWPTQATEVPRGRGPAVQVRQATQPSSQEQVLAAGALTGIVAFLYTHARPPTDRQGWILFCDRVIGLTAIVWLLFGLSFVMLPNEMAAQVALFEGVPSGVELNSVAAATDYRASVGGIQVGAALYLLTMLAWNHKQRPEVQHVTRSNAMSLCFSVWAGLVIARGVGLWSDGFSWYNLLALVSTEGPLLFVTFAGWLHLQIDDDNNSGVDDADALS